MSRKLKPCPFCGSNDLYMVRLCIDNDTPFMSSEDATLAVFCNTCKVCVHVEEAENEGDNDETYDITARAWNRRA